jgi:hypothetical protein
VAALLLLGGRKHVRIDIDQITYLKVMLNVVTPARDQLGDIQARPGSVSP